MATRKPKTAKPRTKRGPPNERLDAMIEALQSGELDEATRKEIVDALRHSRKAHTRGRGVATITWMRAELVRYLMDEHDAGLKDALDAAMPYADDRRRETLRKKYQEIRQGKNPYRYAVSGQITKSRWYAEAVARLKKAQSLRNK